MKCVKRKKGTNEKKREENDVRVANNISTFLLPMFKLMLNLKHKILMLQNVQCSEPVLAEEMKHKNCKRGTLYSRAIFESGIPWS